ncbi:MAG TPA: methylenetetrahydrofolate reductase [Microthrixaceae bacterium]|nr:methylenetetrahydrofolate reductase [Microthrixaceae bacterium]
MARIDDLLAAPDRPVVGVELYRPCTEEGEQRFLHTIDALRELEPTFVSISYGERGPVEGRVRDLVVGLSSQESYPVLAHLTCATHDRAELDAQLEDYERNGVYNVLALAGDPPDGAPRRTDFAHAGELVRAVRARGDQHCIGVAAHPELHPGSTSRARDRSRLAEKLRLADFAISQFTFDAGHYLSMVDDLRRLGVDAPVLPGVMPLSNPEGIRRVSRTAGVEFPEAFARQLEDADPMDRSKLVVEAAAELCEQLLQRGAPGVHLYCLNRLDVVKPLLSDLGLR